MAMTRLNTCVRCVHASFPLWGLNLLLVCLVPLTAMASEEEFVGPFASWLDAQRDCGATGDGGADDTAALQRALDDIREHRRACVL